MACASVFSIGRALLRGIIDRDEKYRYHFD